MKSLIILNYILFVQSYVVAQLSFTKSDLPILIINRQEKDRELLPEKTTILFFNISGHKVETKSTLQNRNSIELDISELPKGMLFLQVHSGQNTTIEKVIKQ